MHLAARAHVIKDPAVSPKLEYRQANVDSAIAVANASASVGVKRFIFVSSIGVNGNVSARPFKQSDTPKPQELYAISKLEAETNLRTLSANTGLPIVIVRPPLVYGPDCPGNFARLLRVVQRGFPLPLGSIANQRSFISIRSLADFLSVCVTHPKAVNETFLVSDGNDLSTPELIRLIANAMGKDPNLWPFPPTVMKFATRLLGRASIYDRLAGDLQIDIEHTFETLGWRPVQTVQEGILEMVHAFVKERH
jgi:nucleoside-diphosphate-sugar epimerase